MYSVHCTIQRIGSGDDSAISFESTKPWRSKRRSKSVGSYFPLEMDLPLRKSSIMEKKFSVKYKAHMVIGQFHLDLKAFSLNEFSTSTNRFTIRTLIPWLFNHKFFKKTFSLDLTVLFEF